MVELRPRLMLPFLGVTLLSHVLVGCGAPSTTPVLAESPPKSSPDSERSNIPSDIQSLANHPAVEALRARTSLMGWVTAVVKLPKATADVRAETKPSLAKRASMFLHDALSENSQELHGHFYLPGQRFPVSYTVETFVAVNQKRIRRDRWSVEGRPPEIMFIGVSRKGVAYADFKQQAPGEYFRLEGKKNPDGSYQVTKVELIDLMDAE